MSVTPFFSATSKLLYNQIRELEDSVPKWINSVYIWYWVNSLRLGVVQLRYKDAQFNICWNSAKSAETVDFPSKKLYLTSDKFLMSELGGNIPIIVSYIHKILVISISIMSNGFSNKVFEIWWKNKKKNKIYSKKII